MDGQESVGRGVDYTKDIEEIRFGGGSTSEDDDDEPRLRIDTSEDDEDCPVEKSSLSSSFSRRKPTTPVRLKTKGNSGLRSVPTTKKFDVKNTNPLQSLQQLVHSHSPFLSAQISVADGGVNQGCKMTSFTPIGLARENRSKSNCDAPSLAAAAEALRNIFSNSHNNSHIHNWDALPTPKPNSGSGAKSKKSSSSSNAAAKRNNTNFQRLSPVSIEVVPSLSHLLPLSQHSPPSPQQAFTENCDSNGSSSNGCGGGGRTTNSNRLNYIVNKLQRSATEEEHLRQLQQLQSSPEAENFKMFQQFLKSGQFQARCNNNNLEILPTASSAATNMINLTNSKGFRYSSSKAQTRPTFGNLSANSFQTTSLPSPPPLTFQTAPEFSNPRMDYRMPPTLTMIPKNVGLGGSGKKTSCRRSPPPMVPIESIANFRKPLNEDNVVYRLKKLGTDIELEKNMAALRDDCGAVAIEDVAAKTATPSVTNNSSSNNSDKAGLSFLKPIPIGERSLTDLKNLAKLHPPPPSLIPIKPQFMPITASLPQSTISEVPIKMKKNSRSRMPPFVSILPKVSVNQNDVLDMAAKIRMNSSGGDTMDGNQYMFGKPSSASDVIFTRKGDMLGAFKQSAMDFSHLRLTAPKNKVAKKKKRNRLGTKSEYTKLAHALVQAATPLPKKEDIDRPVIVPIRNETPPKEFNLNDVEGEIITIEPILMPHSRRESEELANDGASDHEDEFVHVPENRSPSPEPSSTQAQPSTNDTVNDEDYFSFSPTLAIQVCTLPNGRKMISCDICSGVYHKMFSLKKHYYRNHINPAFISAKHAEMFQVPPISATLSANPKFNQSMYWCNICECLFDEKSELSSHLTDHPPMSAENASKNSNKFYMCPTCNTVFSKKRTQERHTKKCDNLFKTAGISTVSTATAKEPTVDSPQSVVEDGQDDNVAEETNSTASSKTNDDVLELDEMPSSSKNSKLETSMMCLFCELSFTDTTKRKKHVLQHHHPKRKQQPCVYCKNKTFSDLSDLLKHICEMHSKRYFGCAICKIRFRTKEDLVAHNAESHDGEITSAEKEPIIEEKVTKAPTISNKNGKNYKCNQCTKVFINTVELGRHRKAAHRDSSRNNVKKVVSAFSGSVDNNEQKYRSTIITTADYETEFYRNVSHNVKYNLENCMEGRIEMKKEHSSQQDEDENDARYADLPGGIGVGKEKSESLSFHDLYGTENIDSRFIQNVSRLHLATQLTMLRKANLLDKELDCPLRSKTSTASRNSSIASHLALAEKSDGERADDEAKNENDAANEIAFSGEWIRARNYICGTCFARFNNFWDMEDHRWSRHPNVYGFYYEFVTEQTPGKNWAMKRTLQYHGSLGVPNNQPLPSSSTCTKCQKSFTPISEFHKHILDCGGDTTWMSMMYAAHTKRNKKWRPYGSRRRKNIARHRGLKRNIPTTPVKIIGPPRNRQKAGDTETIQRMIANLPPKRITRRVITFDDLEPKPRGRIRDNSSSQSNILTRRRKESMEVKSSSSSSSRSQQQHQQQQQQQESKHNVTTSHTLLGTKNNTPYNNNKSSSSTRSHRGQTPTNTAPFKESTPLREETKQPEVLPEISSESNVASYSKNKPAETETTEETVSEPEVCSIKVSTTKGGKTAKIIQAKDTENASEKSTASISSSSETESDTNAKSEKSSSRIDLPTEREPSTESKPLPKGTSAAEEPSNTTVVKITTSWKNQGSSGEPVSIRKLRSTDESNIERERSESVAESKASSSCDERVPHNVTKTEPKSNAEVYSTLELRSGSGLRNKPMIIKIQGDGKQKNEPVTIIRSDKKKKKRCTPITSRRLAAEVPPPPPVASKETENQRETRDELAAETKSVATTEKSEDLLVASVKSKDLSISSEKSADLPDTSAKLEDLPVISDESEDLAIAPKKSTDLSVSPEKSANLSPTPIKADLRDTTEESENLSVAPEKSADLQVSSEKSASETASEVKTEIIEDAPVAFEKSTSEAESALTEETPKDSPFTLEKIIPETTPMVVTEKRNDEFVILKNMTPEMPSEVASEEPADSASALEEKSTSEVSETPSGAIQEIKIEATPTKPDTDMKSETGEDAVSSDAALDSVSTESSTEPVYSSKKNITPVSTPTIDKAVAESEEGELDLSAIEPADEDGPLLPDTSVILAAMKETMRQTDAVISSMPVAVNTSKKRKRDDHSKCKNCGVKVDASTNTTQMCESCTEVPAKKSKPASPPVPKIETFTCKTCHASVPKKVDSNDETCDKCVAAAAAITFVPIASAPATATVPLTSTATATVSVGTTVSIKNDKPIAKKCSSKLKETRIPPPPPFRCGKCDSISLAPLDGSMFCDKCSRLQETVCLLCKSSYISDTNDKVCGKCMLAGSSKQKKRVVDTDATAIVTNTANCDNSEKKSLHCDVCKNATKCTCKRRTSGQLDRATVPEVACDSCGKMWKDDENFGGSVCGVCRSPKTPTKVAGPRISDLKESIKCWDCGIVVVPISSEAAVRKLCDGCFMRQNERRASNEIRYFDAVKSSAARSAVNLQRSPGVFGGLSAATDDLGRSKVEDIKGDHYKEDERPGLVPPPAPAPTTEQKTPMKNVKLICRGCYGVFDTVSSYKYHCDNCKHRSNEKKPLLSFAKRTTKGGPESTSQTEPNNGASFEILEGVQIKYVEMAGSSQSDKAEPGKEPSQIPLVVYESDTSPMKKSDSSRSLKKIKRLHSSPETIMDTIESVIKSVCYDNVDPSSVADSNNEDSDEREKTPVEDVAPVAQEEKPAQKIPMVFRCPLCDRTFQYCALRNAHLRDDHTADEMPPRKMKSKPKDGDDKKESTKKSSSRNRSSKKRPARKRKPAAKRSRKSDNTTEAENPSSAADEENVDDPGIPEAEENQSTEKEPVEVENEPLVNDEEKQSKKSSTTNTPESSNNTSTSNDTERRRSRRRAFTSTAPVPARRTLRSRTKFYENLNDLKNYMEPEEPKSDPEPEPEPEQMDVVDETPVPEASSLPQEDVEKSAPTPKATGKKRKSDSSKNDSKKARTDSNNDLGFAVTKTNKTIPKNCKKNSSNDSKNFEQLGDEVESSSSANQVVPSERTVVTRKTSFTSDNIVAANTITPVAAVPLEGAKRRRSSEISAYDQGSKCSSPSLTPSYENRSRRNSAATVVSSTGEFQNELARSFFDEGQGLESGSEYADEASSKNVTPTYAYDELNCSSFPEQYDSTEGTSHNSSPSYSNSWDFFGQKSLGSIIDTMNEILSRPEVSSCSSETVELFREEMMMFQHFGREITAIDKQEEESKQDEETTTLIDLDDFSKGDKSKLKIESEAGCSSTNTFSEECDICDQTFSDPSALQSHMSAVHNNETISKNFKDNRLKLNSKSNQNGMKANMKHKCSHCQKVLQNRAETLVHMKEHWKSFASSKSGDNSSHLKNSIADKLEELLLDKALMNYLKSPQETQHRNNLPLKILNQISLAKKTQFTNWKSALAQMLDMDAAGSPPTTTTTTTTTPGPASPVEPASVPVEPKPEETKTKSQSTETSSNSNPDPIDGYPCPMCNKTFQYTRLRNTHLIMVHAPRQSTHKHLIEGKSNSKKGERSKSSNENRDGNVRSSSAREKIFHSYLLNDSVNTVMKKESQDDSLPLSKPNAASTSTSTSSFPLVGGSKDTKKQEKLTIAVKSEPSVSTSSSSTTTPTTTTATSSPTSSSSVPAAAANKPNTTTNVPAAKSFGNGDNSSNAKKKKPCRKKMSKKEMNLPPAIVKMKAEQALLQLCNSRFNRICSQT